MSHFQPKRIYGKKTLANKTLCYRLLLLPEAENVLKGFSFWKRNVTVWGWNRRWTLEILTVWFYAKIDIISTQPKRNGHSELNYIRMCGAELLLYKIWDKICRGKAVFYTYSRVEYLKIYFILVFYLEMPFIFNICFILILTLSFGLFLFYLMCASTPTSKKFQW